MKGISVFSCLIVILLHPLEVFSQAPKGIPKDTPELQVDSVQSDTLIPLIPTRTVLSATRADSLIQYAYTFMGKRYRRGGTTMRGFDCSGYTMTVFKSFGIRLPHTSAGQSLMGVEIGQKNIRKGDLVFFRGRNMRSRRIGHVGIVISEKGEPVRFIHSSTSEGIRIDRMDYIYYKKRYLKAVRLPL